MGQRKLTSGWKGKGNVRTLCEVLKILGWMPLHLSGAQQLGRRHANDASERASSEKAYCPAGFATDQTRGTKTQNCVTIRTAQVQGLEPALSDFHLRTT